MIKELEQQCRVGRICHIKGNFIVMSTPELQRKMQILSVKNAKNLRVSDIVSISAEGDVCSLWQPALMDNTIFATSVCNQQCRFCPQAKVGNIHSFSPQNSALFSTLKHNDMSFVTITGGEPTLLGADLPAMLQKLLSINPKTSIAILTNGMSFDDASYAAEVVKAGRTHTRICIALHSDVPSIHDSITGVPGAFERTSLGLLNLQRAGANIEIRIVMNRLNCERFLNMAFSIGMNFPFVTHVAFMGLELHEEAAKHANEVWVNPLEYMEQLSLAIYYLQCRGIPVSIYNLPYCLVPNSLWPFLCDSISAWKKTFLPICEPCSKKAVCPGLFATSTFQSPSIKPL